MRLCASLAALLCLLSGISKAEDSAQVDLAEHPNLSFHEGLALWKRDGRFGYVDTSGRVVIEARFPKAFRFSEGRARVCAPPSDPTLLFRLARLIGYEDHQAYPCGYIDRSGALVIDYLYLPARGFKGGYAEVTTLGGRRGFVDPSGRFFLDRPAPASSP